MDNDITNKILLDHMLAMKSGLEEKIEGLQQQMDTSNKNYMNLTAEMRQGFEDARLHRQALQEDLEATMLMLSKHDKKLARL